MLHGKILAGEETFDVHRWKNDRMDELYNDDALWAYMIRASEEIRLQDRERINDPVLRRLLAMGVYDWTQQDRSLNSTLPALRYSAAMGSRLLNRILEEEDKVGLSLPIQFGLVNDFPF
jgi:hypothetical protein